MPSQILQNLSSTLLSLAILFFFFLFVYAKVSKRKMTEILSSMFNMMKDDDGMEGGRFGPK